MGTEVDPEVEEKDAEGRVVDESSAFSSVELEGEEGDEEGVEGEEDEEDEDEEERERD